MCPDHTEWLRRCPAAWHNRLHLTHSHMMAERGPNPPTSLKCCVKLKAYYFEIFLFNYKEKYIYIKKEISNICLDLKEWTVRLALYGLWTRTKVSCCLLSFSFSQLGKTDLHSLWAGCVFWKALQAFCEKNKTKQRGIKRAQTLSIQNRAQTNTAEPDV